MKHLLFALLAFLAVSASMADDIPVQWDHDLKPGEVADPDMPITFRVEVAPITKPEAWRLKAEGITTKEFTIKGLAPGVWNARVFAVAGGISSEPSNILRIEIQPQPPRQPVKVALQQSSDLKNWTEIASTYTGSGNGRTYFRTVIDFPKP